MKILVTALALVTVIAAPAFAQKQAPASPNAVVVDGKVIGQDPDANVRYDLLKTWQHGID